MTTMKLLKSVALICLICIVTNAQAYITYQNGRIDRALYDGHDLKTIVSGTITKVDYRYKEYTPSNGMSNSMILLDEGPLYASINFSIQQVIMGDSSLIGKNVKLALSSFDWPEELVKLDSGSTCIFILKDWNWKPDSVDLHIEVVIPSSSLEILIKTPAYFGFNDNKTAKNYLENRLLLVLKEELSKEKLREVLIQIGPILTKENSHALDKFIMHENAWVKRAALSALVFSSQKEEYVKLLAADIENYFSQYNEKDMLKNQEEFNGYAPFYLYYRFVFFLDPNDRTWGTRWDEQEENLNKQCILKIKATELLSKSTCRKLAI